MENVMTKVVSHFVPSFDFLSIRKFEMESHCKETEGTNSMELSPS
jgi:hypothetical protein